MFLIDHLQLHNYLGSLLFLNRDFWASLQTYMGPAICIYQAPQLILEYGKAGKSLTGLENLKENARGKQS